MMFLKQIQERLSIKQDYRALFSTPLGQKVLADILRRAGVTHPVFEADPDKERFNSGHRHLALSIYRLVHSSDEQLLKLLSEEMHKQSLNHDAH